MSHRIFQNHNIPPHELYEMDEYHKAFIYASEQIVVEEEKREARRAQMRSRRR